MAIGIEQADPLEFGAIDITNVACIFAFLSIVTFSLGLYFYHGSDPFCP